MSQRRSSTRVWPRVFNPRRPNSLVFASFWWWGIRCYQKIIFPLLLFRLTFFPHIITTDVHQDTKVGKVCVKNKSRLHVKLNTQTVWQGSLAVPWVQLLLLAVTGLRWFLICLYSSTTDAIFSLFRLDRKASLLILHIPCMFSSSVRRTAGAGLVDFPYK